MAGKTFFDFFDSFEPSVARRICQKRLHRLRQRPDLAARAPDLLRVFEARIDHLSHHIRRQSSGPVPNPPALGPEAGSVEVPNRRGARAVAASLLAARGRARRAAQGGPAVP